jgi:hypothetical protein
MSDSYVCSGAVMRCTMGTSPANLTVLPIRTVNLTGPPMANISDHKSMVNLAPFGLCRSLGFPPTASATAAAHGHLTPMPCMHNTPAPWMGGKMDYLIKGQPALLKSCKCQCMWGGTISLVTDGQVGEGVQYVTKKLKSNFKQTLSQFVSNDFKRENRNAFVAGLGNVTNGSNTNQGEQQPSSNNRNTQTSPNTTQSTTLNSILGKIAEVERVKEIVLKRFSTLTDDDKKRAQEMVKEMPDNLTKLEKLALAINNLELEKALDTQKQKMMTVKEADSQYANPGYLLQKFNFFGVLENFVHPFKINCATTSPAYALRIRGFNVTAKGNTKSNTNVEYLSQGNFFTGHAFDVWKNIDDTPATPITMNDWLKSKGYTDMKMTKERYLEFFNENTKEPGIYELNIGWRGDLTDENGNIIKRGIDKGGHATILQRFPPRDGELVGELRYIEPQIDNSVGSGNEDMNLNHLASSGAWYPAEHRGIMRIDNKLFDPAFSDIFNVD